MTVVEYTERDVRECDTPECPFPGGEVEGSLILDRLAVFSWRCPVCGREHEEDVDSDDLAPEPEPRDCLSI